MLQEQPYRKVTPQQMEVPDVWSLVLIAQDVWHVLNRILAKVNRDHPNLPALKAELKLIFSIVSKKAPRLTAGSFEGLQTKITHLAQQLSQQLNALGERFKVFEDHETTQNRALRDLREAFAADDVDEVLEDGLAVDQTASHFTERQPTAIAVRDPISTAVVQPVDPENGPVARPGRPEVVWPGILSSALSRCQYSRCPKINLMMVPCE
jgi:hypothetical protein